METDREICISLLSIWPRLTGAGARSLALSRPFHRGSTKDSPTAGEGSQDLTAGSDFLRRFGDPTNTGEAQSFKELYFSQELLRNRLDLFIRCQTEGGK